MALNWGLLVVLFTLNVGFSEANNGTTLPVAATIPTTSFVATTTQNAAATITATAAASATAAATTSATNTVVPPAPTTSPPKFNTHLKVSFKSSECAAANDSLLNSTFQGFYNDAVFDLMDISFDVERVTCLYNFTIKFGPKLPMYNISEVFRDKLKSLSYTVGTLKSRLKLTDIQTEVYIPALGVTLGDFKPENCKKICCDGAGGEVTLSRKCTPSKSAGCKIFTLKKEVRDCMKVCGEELECSGVMCKISLLVLFFGAFMNKFLK